MGVFDGEGPNRRCKVAREGFPRVDGLSLGIRPCAGGCPYHSCIPNGRKSMPEASQPSEALERVDRADVLCPWMERRVATTVRVLELETADVLPREASRRAPCSGERRGACAKTLEGCDHAGLAEGLMRSGVCGKDCSSTRKSTLGERSTRRMFGVPGPDQEALHACGWQNLEETQQSAIEN